MAKIPKKGAAPEETKAEIISVGDLVVSDEPKKGKIVSIDNAPSKKQQKELAPAFDPNMRIYRGSLIGSCTTALVALQLKDKLGLDISEELPPQIRKAAQEGTNAERHIIDKFCTEYGYRRATFPEFSKLKENGVIAGYNSEMEQVVTWKEITKKAALRTHPDWLVWDSEGNLYDLEVKFFGKDYFKAYKSKGMEGLGELGVKYEWQISARMGSHDLPLIFVAAEKVFGASDQEPEIGELIPTAFVDGAPIPWKQIVKKIKQCEEYVKEGILPDDCGKAVFGCPAFKLPQCGAADEKKSGRELKVLEDTTLADLLRLQWAYANDEKQAKTANEAVKREIKKRQEEMYPDAAKFTYEVKDEAGNVFHWQWQEIDQPEKVIAAFTSRWSKVTLKGGPLLDATVGEADGE